MVVNQVDDAAVNRHERNLRAGHGDAVLFRVERNLGLLPRPAAGRACPDRDVEFLGRRIDMKRRVAEIAFRLVKIGRAPVVFRRAGAHGVGGERHVDDRQPGFPHRHAEHGRVSVQLQHFFFDNALALDRHQIPAFRQGALNQNLGRIAGRVQFFVRRHRDLVVVIAAEPHGVGACHIKAPLRHGLASIAVGGGQAQNVGAALLRLYGKLLRLRSGFQRPLAPAFRDDFAHIARVDSAADADLPHLFPVLAQKLCGKRPPAGGQRGRGRNLPVGSQKNVVESDRVALFREAPEILDAAHADIKARRMHDGGRGGGDGLPAGIGHVRLRAVAVRHAFQFFAAGFLLRNAPAVRGKRPLRRVEPAAPVVAGDRPEAHVLVFFVLRTETGRLPYPVRLTAGSGEASAAQILRADVRADRVAAVIRERRNGRGGLEAQALKILHAHRAALRLVAAVPIVADLIVARRKVVGQFPCAPERAGRGGLSRKRAVYGRLPSGVGEFDSVPAAVRAVFPLVQGTVDAPERDGLAGSVKPPVREQKRHRLCPRGGIRRAAVPFSAVHGVPPGAEHGPVVFRGDFDIKRAVRSGRGEFVREFQHGESGAVRADGFRAAVRADRLRAAVPAQNCLRLCPVGEKQRAHLRVPHRLAGGKPRHKHGGAVVAAADGNPQIRDLNILVVDAAVFFQYITAGCVADFLRKDGLRGKMHRAARPRRRLFQKRRKLHGLQNAPVAHGFGRLHGGRHGGGRLKGAGDAAQGFHRIKRPRAEILALEHKLRLELRLQHQKAGVPEPRVAGGVRHRNRERALRLRHAAVCVADSGERRKLIRGIESDRQTVDGHRRAADLKIRRRDFHFRRGADAGGDLRLLPGGQRVVEHEPHGIGIARIPRRLRRGRHKLKSSERMERQRLRLLHGKAALVGGRARRQRHVHLHIVGKSVRNPHAEHIAIAFGDGVAQRCAGGAVGEPQPVRDITGIDGG